MKKLVIKEVIIVEGKHDYQKIKACVEADVLVSQGTHVSHEFLAECRRFNEERGIIVFTDPDGPGEYIRSQIIKEVGSCKHASLNVIQTKKKQKVGIEHADCEDIVTALNKAATFTEHQESLSWADFFELGLSGQKNSQQLRNILAEKFHIPVTNAKRCHKYLNMLGITKEICLKTMKEFLNEDHCE